MAQLVGVDTGRMRLLSCGRCGTRWQFKRTGCPFCETDSQQLASVALLADWSSLHLDLIAHERGLKRMAASLYEFEPLRHP